jgi:hypothetical protein
MADTCCQQPYGVEPEGIEFLEGQLLEAFEDHLLCWPRKVEQSWITTMDKVCLSLCSGYHIMKLKSQSSKQFTGAMSYGKVVWNSKCLGRVSFRCLDSSRLLRIRDEQY